jgi:transitional endoplasmic reticulum ATPase
MGRFTPLIGESVWFMTTTLAIGATVVGALVCLLILVEAVSSFVHPIIRGRTVYTILGGGGLLGTCTAVVASGGTWIVDADLLGNIMPPGTGESPLALVAVAAPFVYVFYKLYTPASGPVTVGTNDGDKMDPEVVKERTEQWSPEAAINPAFPTGQGPNDPSSRNGDQSSPTHDDEDSGTNGAGTESIDGPSLASEMEFNWLSETDVSFEDIGGMEDLKNELRTEVIKPLENREKAEELGVSSPNIVFYGPPGTGKTYTAEALATELDLPFAKLSGADVQSKWINESATKVNNLFREAQQVAAKEGGAVVFLDELDSVLKARSGSGIAHEEDNKVVNEFLNHLEDTKDHDIVFIGATNRLESLDEAGIRPGRIDKKIIVGKPNVTDRAAIIRAQLADRPHQISDTGITTLAAKTKGAVAADLKLLVERAAKQTLARNGDEVRWIDIRQVCQSTSDE